MNQDRPLQADLRRVIYALSDALDLVGIDDLEHGKRVGVMAAQCANTMGLCTAEKSFLFNLGLMHDIGVSSTAVHRHLVETFDWESSQVHCEVGHDLLCTFPPLSEMALPVRYHHTRWDHLLTQDIDPHVARSANLIHLVDRVDAMVVQHAVNGRRLMHTDSIRQKIAEHRGIQFSDEVVTAFLVASRSEAFWLMLEPRSIQGYLADMLAFGEPYVATVAELKKLGIIFSRIVDAKSPFTSEHSMGVSRLSRFIADRMGVSPENCDKVEIAGLLHDIGKLRIPDEILDKPGKLDERERKVMNTHSFETYQILHLIPGFEDIAPWAAYHHEEPGGSGYPFHLLAENLPLEARILHVADIFQAMAQDRPYRDGLSAEALRGFMDGLVQDGRVDARIVAVATEDMDASMSAACGSASMEKSNFGKNEIAPRKSIS